MSTVGTVARGIRTPIITQGDNLASIVVDSLLNAQKEEGFKFQDKDIVAITEAVVSIADGNYATLDQIGLDIKNKFNSKHIGLVYPILSRNRFSNVLRSVARVMDKLTILLSFPKDEVGNSIMFEEDLKKLGINVSSDVITEDYYQKHLSNFVHPFTGVNMVNYYKSVGDEENCEIEFVFSNKGEEILNYTNQILVCDIHTRKQSKELLSKVENTVVYGLEDILNESISGSGFNKNYGLLGSNAATKESVKLFPHKNHEIVNQIQTKLKEITNKEIEVMIYGDGAFKDPIGMIWELADPVVSPSYTSGLEGSPNEIKLKYISDSKFKHLKGEALQEAVKKEITDKNDEQTSDSKLGTTPRRYVDLIGSLCDLVSGSGDKGTPVIFIQNYFKNYSQE